MKRAFMDRSQSLWNTSDMNRPFLAMLALIALLSVPGVAAETTQELRERVDRGEWVALTKVLDQLEAAYHGRPAGVTLVRSDDDDTPLYRIEWLGPDGEVVRIHVEARTGEIRGLEGIGVRTLERR